MSSEKMSQLAPITAVASGDYFPVVTAAATENKRVDIGVLDDRYASSALASEALASGNAALVIPEFEGGRARLKLGANYTMPNGGVLNVDSFYDGIGTTDFESYGFQLGLTHEF